MTINKPSLVETNGVWSGSNSLSWTTLGVVGDGLRQQTYANPYFTNMQFLGNRNGAQSDAEITNGWQAADLANTTNVFDINYIDPYRHELVVESFERIKNNRLKNNPLDLRPALLEFNMHYSIREIDTTVDEYADVRRWKALNKLSVEEIKLLKLESQMVHLKLKFSGAGPGDLDNIPF